MLDLGCGEGRLLTMLQGERAFTRILATDVSLATLGIAARRLHCDRFTEAQRARRFQHAFALGEPRQLGR